MSFDSFCDVSTRAHRGLGKTFTSLLIAGLSLLGTAYGQSRFSQVSSYPAGGSLPVLLAQHDVNGDGKLDAIVLNVNATAKTETVSLLLGNGSGGYQAPTTMGTYPSTYGTPLAADLNLDGRLDLIFSVASPQQTLVYLGTGETFESKAISSKGVGCAASAPTYCTQTPELLVADLNKDGNPDLVEAPDYYGTIYVMLGNGRGGFRAPVPVSSGSGPFAIGDFDNDGILDFADIGYNDNSQAGLQVVFGNGDGTFRQGKFVTTSYTGGYGLPITADLRGTGDTDIVLPLGDGQSCGSGGLEVLLGNGNGTFADNPSSYKTGGSTYNILVADINGDNRPDLIAANQQGSTYSVLLNHGNGKFLPAVNYMSPSGLAGNFVVGDLSGNGRADVTISSIAGLQVFINVGGGHLRAPTAIELDEIPSTTLSADLNKDGIPDLAFTEYPANNGLNCYYFSTAGVLLSKDGAPLTAPATKVYPGGGDVPAGFNLSGLGDFNHDGNIDLLLGFYSPELLPYGGLSVVANSGKGSFIASSLTPLQDGSLQSVADFNGDGNADVAQAVSGGIEIDIGDGTGNLTPTITYPVNSFVSFMSARDLNKDGKPDLLALTQDGVVVLISNGDGTFQIPQAYATVTNPNSLALADFNRDGHIDLVVGGGSEISVLLGTGDGTFKPATNFAAGGPVSAIAAPDLRGNGDDDVVIADSTDDKLFLLAGKGNGTFEKAALLYGGGGGPNSLTVGDFNQDGAPDLAIGDSTTLDYMILYNQGGTTITLTSSNTSLRPGESVTFTAIVSASNTGAGTPSGGVGFKDGSGTLGTAKLTAGKATFSTKSLSPGTHSITAEFYGTSSFNPRASSAITEKVSE